MGEGKHRGSNSTEVHHFTRTSRKLVDFPTSKLSLSFSPFLSLFSRTHASSCVDTTRIHLDNLYPPPFIPYRTPTALPFPPQPLHHSPLFPYSSIAQRRRIVPIHQPLLVGSKRKRRIERGLEDGSRSFDCELR